MTVDDTLRYSLSCYGNTIYSHRTDVLHHLFLVIGNGYEWRNGEMVDRFLKGNTLQELISKTLAEQEKQRRAARLHGFNWMKEHGLPAPIFKDPVRPSPEQVEDLIKTPGKVKSFYPGELRLL